MSSLALHIITIYTLLSSTYCQPDNMAASGSGGPGFDFGDNFDASGGGGPGHDSGDNFPSSGSGGRFGMSFVFETV